MGAERWDEQVGTVADEASRLLESLRRSAAEAAAGEPAASAGDPADVASPSDGTAAGSHDPLCQWCPLCRGAAVVRSLSPETLTRLADLAALAATVLADLASTRATGPDRGDPPSEDEAAGPQPGHVRTGRTTAANRPTPSRPIPVRDADDPQEAPRG